MLAGVRRAAGRWCRGGVRKAGSAEQVRRCHGESGTRYPVHRRLRSDVLQRRYDELTEEQVRVAVLGGTEAPWCGEFVDHDADGVFVCVVSQLPLFDSTDKFDSGSGWPSFTQPIHPDHVVEVRDTSGGMVRTEVRSAVGDAHLGHVFDDIPAVLGRRYCINSAALQFVPRRAMADHEHRLLAKLPALCEPEHMRVQDSEK